MQHILVSINELKDDFFYLKRNKGSMYDEISFNVIKKSANYVNHSNMHSVYPLELGCYQTD